MILCDWVLKTCGRQQKTFYTGVELVEHIPNLVGLEGVATVLFMRIDL